mgnify:CR=1 FL=1
MNRAYAAIQLKSIDAAKRTFAGVATTPSTDRSGDVVEPKGAKFKLPIPLLWQHDSRQPIGWVTRAKVSANGIEIDGEIADVPDAGALKDRLSEAWQSIKAGLVRGLSIGFAPLKDGMEPIDAKNPWGAMRFTSWEWLELSAVTIPANQDASITAIKSIDDRIRLAAPGRSPDRPSNQSAGASAPNLKGNKMNTMQEQVTEIDDLLTTRRTRMGEIDGEVEKSGGVFTPEQRAEIATLNQEIADLETRKAMKQGQIASAASAVAVESKGAPRSASFFVKRADPDDKFVGQSYTRKILAKCIAHLSAKNGNPMRPSDVADRLWGKTHPQLVQVIKANEVAGGGTGSGEWGAELVQIDTRYSGDFIDFLYAKTVFDRLPLREIPARVRVKGRDGQSTGFWVGESKAIKVTTGDFSGTDTTPYKVGAIVTMSKELLEDSDPSVEMLMRDGLEEALRQRIDTTFLSATAASAGVSPAGLLNGLSAVAGSNGPDAQSARTDYRALIAPFITAKNVGGLYWVTTPTLAVGLASMVNALGQPEFQGITVDGGTYMGYPMITGDNVGSGDILLLKPSDIWKIGDSGVQVQVSDSAMIEQSSAPTGEQDTPAAATATLVSMYQEDAVAIKVTRRISFGKRRSSAVQWIDDAAYGAEAS